MSAAAYTRTQQSMAAPVHPSGVYGVQAPKSFGCTSGTIDGSRSYRCYHVVNTICSTLVVPVDTIVDVPSRLRKWSSASKTPLTNLTQNTDKDEFLY
ncbi:Hypothetical protein CINCED_3A010300 [Cinara cedri]|uniref:Uncharacterized protein n=1 Tax=Cinara cedri TaxID=506608 RepID=A0A5E4M7L6_9HEMI|nr:Hypothetical protein CINCED_3A010300 [Cinara cedri]